jgi:hypothetical protein
MPITINGTGSITGLTAGGLPDLSIATADIADGAITGPKLDGAQSGSAPIYGARAWVNFNGNGTIAIRGSGNVSSITDNNVGNYTVNFTTAMADNNYVAITVLREGSDTAVERIYPATPVSYATGSVGIRCMEPTSQQNTDAVATDPAFVNVAIFR